MNRYLVLLLLPVLVVASGPDRGGYRWIDSDGPGGPAFNWIDIAGTGTKITLGDDDNQGPFALGFSHGFYGKLYDSVRVCSNGWLSFTSESHQFHHFPVPDTRDPNSLLAPLWADLDPAQGGSVYYLADTAQGRFVVTWLNVPFHSSRDSCTFQVVLDTSGSALFQYLRVPPATRLGSDSCSVGIENDSGLIGLEYLRNGTPGQNLLHDSLAVRFYRLQKDVCPSLVLRPVGQAFVGDSVAPLVKLWNPGRSAATFPVTLSIGAGYEAETTVTDLAPLAEKLLLFPAWVPAEESCELELVTSLSGDEFPANDTLRTELVGSYAGELRYDDGEPDAWYMKNGSPTNEWAGAVRFSVPYGQFHLRGARVFVDDTTRFSRVVVCPDSGDAPQVSNPYLLADSVGASQPQSWIDITADTLLNTDVDLWLVAFWQARAVSPQIGEDRETPIDRRSYFGSPTVRWFAYNSGDVMARLRIDGQVGITEFRSVRMPRLEVTPNPFRRALTVCLTRGTSSGGLQIRDATGRRVRDIRLSASGSAVWDGCDQAGRRLPAGAYFVIARTDSSARVVKVLMTER
ncbi:hypothetical protein FJY68_11245 [candidate division WOR-3 bacterium]|uniref:FlgD/Vpr Ig-like domain-containing protein n=1 Tax=candidate division WOR-3 bacterium TaxID=2052148 RepID=A0A937XFW6_UNCW3|nr:hypothetical protein [candidate division WOR-3 bacterium]